MLSALEDHPWRTKNPSEADFFIIPTPIATLLATSSISRKSTVFDEAFGNLTAHPLFREHSHKHIIVSLHWAVFNSKFKDKLGFPLASSYPKLQNVTVATHMDADRVSQTYGDLTRSTGAFSRVFRLFRQVTCCSFSVGLWSSDVPLMPIKYKTWVSKRLHLFYHTRTRNFGAKSTPYRNAPINLTIANSSIGLDIPAEQWLEDITSSKFCLIVRGDTPHSHALLRAVRVGCMPVIVSDLYSRFAPTLPSTLDLTDFCIIVKERAYMNDTKSILVGLGELDESYLRNKTENLAWAQRVIFPDYEDSLFVPAFFREASTARVAQAKRIEN